MTLVQTSGVFLWIKTVLMRKSLSSRFLANHHYNTVQALKYIRQKREIAEFLLCTDLI